MTATKSKANWGQYKIMNIWGKGVSCDFQERRVDDRCQPITWSTVANTREGASSRHIQSIDCHNYWKWKKTFSIGYLAVVISASVTTPIAHNFGHLRCTVGYNSHSSSFHIIGLAFARSHPWIMQRYLSLGAKKMVATASRSYQRQAGSSLLVQQKRLISPSSTSASSAQLVRHSSAAATTTSSATMGGHDATSFKPWPQPAI